MKLNDTIYLPNIALRDISENAVLPGIKNLCDLILKARKEDLDIIFFEQSTPTWDEVPRWSEKTLLSEGSLYDHVKRKTGLTYGDYTYRITPYVSLGGDIQDISLFFDERQVLEIGRGFEDAFPKDVKFLGHDKGLLFSEDVFNLTWLVRAEHHAELGDQLRKRGFIFTDLSSSIPKIELVSYPCLYEVTLIRDRKTKQIHFVSKVNECSTVACLLLVEKVFVS